MDIFGLISGLSTGNVASLMLTITAIFAWLFYCERKKNDELSKKIEDVIKEYADKLELVVNNYADGQSSYQECMLKLMDIMKDMNARIPSK